jgi:hypothetical protein
MRCSDCACCTEAATVALTTLALLACVYVHCMSRVEGLAAAGQEQPLAVAAAARRVISLCLPPAIAAGTAATASSSEADDMATRLKALASKLQAVDVAVVEPALTELAELLVSEEVSCMLLYCCYHVLKMCAVLCPRVAFSTCLFGIHSS